MMAELSISALLIRFVLGGAAVVLATIVAKIVGQKAGGIFAAFPAAYLAALQNFPNEKAHCFSCGMIVRSNQACLQTR